MLALCRRSLFLMLNRCVQRRALLLGALALASSCVFAVDANGRDRKDNQGSVHKVEKAQTDGTGQNAQTDHRSQPPDQAADSSTAGSLAELSHQLERLRKLKFKHPVESVELGPEEVREEIDSIVSADLSETQERALVWLLSTLGLIPQQYDLRENVVDALVQQVAGYYEPDKSRMVLVTGALSGIDSEQLPLSEEGMKKLILLHELDHALTDQHFDLGSMLQKPRAALRDDMLLAHRALAEGDATLAMLLSSFDSLGIAVDRNSFPMEQLVPLLGQAGAVLPGTEDLPSYIRAMLIEPYMLGLRYVMTAWTEGGWEAVDALWRNPPQSSEQLLHPDRIDDTPTAVRLPQRLRRRAQLATTEFGELGVRTWLESELGRERAAEAAAGWDGDRAAIYAKSVEQIESTAMIRWDSVWDSAEDAAEFVLAARQWFAARADAVQEDLQIDISQRRTRVRIAISTQ